jgi:Phytanoyl-CoA dioxygenase (PhyH)
MKNCNKTLAELENKGFASVSKILSKADRQHVLSALGTIRGAGRRGVLGIAEIARWARSPQILKLASLHTRPEPRPVRAIYFDKFGEANWLVGWHQDLTVAVRERIDVPGFGPWTVKEGVTHVHAPAVVLEGILTVRVHLDDCDETNGALRVLPGTHRFGRLSAQRIRELRATVAEIPCCLSAGDVLLMRPLLLHASGKSLGCGHRRVLHIEYAGPQLPGGLQWHEQT